MKIFQSILCIMLLGISVASWGQEKKAYRLFDANGKEVGYREIMKVLKNHSQNRKAVDNLIVRLPIGWNMRL